MCVIENLVWREEEVNQKKIFNSVNNERFLYPQKLVKIKQIDNFKILLSFNLINDLVLNSVKKFEYMAQKIITGN